VIYHASKLDLAFPVVGQCSGILLVGCSTSFLKIVILPNARNKGQTSINSLNAYRQA
jgi:hypothetical protein